MLLQVAEECDQLVHVGRSESLDRNAAEESRAAAVTSIHNEKKASTVEQVHDIKVECSHEEFESNLHNGAELECRPRDLFNASEGNF